MTCTKKVKQGVWTGIIWLLSVGLFGSLLLSCNQKGKVIQASDAATQLVPGKKSVAITGQPPGPLLDPSAFQGLNKEEQQRVLIAATLHSRFQARGRHLIVEATGKEHRIFRFSWPPNKVDKFHMEALKKAEPLFRDLRSRGFQQVIIQVGEKTVWTRDL